MKPFTATTARGRSPAALETLPGIGSATVRSIAAFAFNLPTVFVETNIWSVFIHYLKNNPWVRICRAAGQARSGAWQKNPDGVSDSATVPLVEATLNRNNPRGWCSALMDYGVMIKETYVNPNRQSVHYMRQPPFRGSNREVRGTIVRCLAKRWRGSETEIKKLLPFDGEGIKK